MVATAPTKEPIVTWDTASLGLQVDMEALSQKSIFISQTYLAAWLVSGGGRPGIHATPLPNSGLQFAISSAKVFLLSTLFT